MRKQPITVVVNLPATPEGAAAYDKAMVAFNSLMISGALNRMDVLREQKVDFIASLQGVAPWAGDKP